MAKPTERTDWADQGDGSGGASNALRTPTDSSRWNFGWKTLPNNDPSEVGEAPNLNQQNYWQYAVHKWLQWFSGEIPDNTARETIDLWEWAPGNIGGAQGDRVGYYLSDIDQNITLAGALSFAYTDPSASSSLYASRKADIFSAARYYELTDMFQQGIGLQLVDGAGVIWQIIPHDFGSYSLQENGLAAINFIADMDIANATNSVTLDATLANSPFTIIKNDGGTVTEPSDFATFTALDSTNFTTRNPNGVRAILSVTKSVATRNSIYSPESGSFLETLYPSRLKPVVRRHFRPMITGLYDLRFNDGTLDQYYPEIPLIRGKSYRCSIQSGDQNNGFMSGVNWDGTQLAVYCTDSSSTPNFSDDLLALIPVLETNSTGNGDKYFSQNMYFQAISGAIGNSLELALKSVPRSLGNASTGTNRFSVACPMIVVEEL